MEAKIDFIENCTVLDLKENDIVVLKSKRKLSDEEIVHLSNRFKDAIPEQLEDKIKVVITDDIEIGILRSKI